LNENSNNKIQKGFPAKKKRGFAGDFSTLWWVQIPPPALFNKPPISHHAFNQLDGFPMAISSLHMIQNLQAECIQVLTTRYG
jgi:hypothetical protein